MLNESVAVAVKVSRGINLLEKHGLAWIEENHALIGKILSARRTIVTEKGKASLPLDFGLAALASASDAQNKMSIAMRLVAECHEHLSIDRSNAGLDVVAFGDECPWPTGTLPDHSSRPQLKAVS